MRSKPITPTIDGAAAAVVLDPADLIDVQELAKRLRVRPSCIHEWLRKRGTPNCLPSFKLGRYLRFSWREVSMWILAQRNKKGASGRRKIKKTKQVA